MRRCKLCILPETYPGIAFNEEGICNFCLNHKKRSVLGEDELKKVLYSRRGKKYDCVVPVSGGRDSTFALYVAKRKLGLKVLAVHYDNGFCEEQALINIKNACEKLDIDLVTVKSKRNIEKKYVRNAIKASAPFGSFWGICQFCYYGIHTIAYQIAKKEGAPFILWGNHSSESGLQNPYVGLSGFREALKGASISNITKAFPYFIMMTFCLLLHRLEFYVHEKGFWRLVFNPRKFIIITEKNNKIKNVFLYDYIEWDGKKIVKIIKEELDWKSPVDKEWRFDCKLHAFGNYKYLKSFGISQDGVGYSNMIREGKLSRTEALKRIKCEENMEKLRSHIEIVFKELGLSKDIFDAFDSVRAHKTASR